MVRPEFMVQFMNIQETIKHWYGPVWVCVLYAIYDMPCY